MKATNFIENFAEALDVEPADLSEETEFRTLEVWDSMVYLSVIAMLDEEYDILIENSDFKTLKTIGDIINFIETH